jgi:hypothetical protein
MFRLFVLNSEAPLEVGAQLLSFTRSQLPFDSNGLVAEATLEMAAKVDIVQTRRAILQMFGLGRRQLRVTFCERN